MARRRKRTRTRVGNDRQAALRRQLLFGALWIALALLIGYGVWYVTRLPAVTIREVEVQGGETISHESVRSLAEEELAGSYMLLVPRRFSLSYPEDAIRARVEALPRVHNVRVKRVSQTALSVTFEEYVPHALWCAESATEGGGTTGDETDERDSATIASNCLFVDETGYAFAEAPALSGTTFLRYVTSVRPPSAGAPLFPPERMREVEAFAATLLDAYGMRTWSVTETADGDLAFTLTAGGEVLLPPNGNIEELFANLDTVLQSDEFKTLTPGAFEYIDLRFPGRVYVREEPESVYEIENEVGTSTETDLED
jgi:cell division septal protein FtsQ